MRLWRSAFMQGGVAALRKRVPPGPAPTRAERALEVVEAVLAAPVSERPHWTRPRLAEAIERRSGLRISRSRLSGVLRQRGRSAGGALATR